jgi:uncharacterized membrane protein YbhN (UPF0104 family)
MGKKNLKLFIKIGISVLLITFLFRNSNFTETVQHISRSNWLIWFAGVVLYISGQIICAYKWKFLSHASGFKGSFENYIEYYFTGMFFNLFMPTTIGGDAVKCYYLSKSSPDKDKMDSVYSVLADRVSGVMVLIWLAALIIFLPVSSVLPCPVKFFLALSSLVFIVFITSIPLVYKIFENNKVIKNILDNTKIYWGNHLLLLKALNWSFVFHLLVILIHIMIGYSVGIEISPAYYFILYPMSALAGFLPVSFNGIGPREAVYVYFFSLVGVQYSAAMAFGVFWFGIVLISSLIGGFFYIKNKHIGLENEEDRLSEV